MKYAIICCFLLTSFASLAQNTKKGDEILGVWKTGSGKGKVEIIKKGDQYLGKIVWLNEPIDPKTGKPKTDIQHPDHALHQRPLLGLVNLWGFQFKGDNKWEDGHIYDPNNGKDYKCIITLKDINTLNVRGYIGISLIGRNDTWTRSSL